MNPIQYKITSDFTKSDLKINFHYENIHVITKDQTIIITIIFDADTLKDKVEIENKSRCLKLIIMDIISFITETPITFFNSQCLEVQEPIEILDSEHVFKMGNKDFTWQLETLIKEIQEFSPREKKQFQTKLRLHRYRLLEINKLVK